VILDTYEIAVVHGANPDLAQLHRPIVRIAVTAEGGRTEGGPLVDLASVDETGNYRRSIIKVTEGIDYGINMSDYSV
jgi:hypothetical protein